MSTTTIHGGLVGRVVSGRFTLLRWLSSHRGVETYLTEFGDPSQKATIKLVPGGSGEAEARMAGWLAAANLSHPHLIKLFTSGRCEIDSSPMLYVVTEYADEVLAEILPERALTPQEAKEALGPAVDALAYLHAKGFVHGRMKPSNIMAVGDRLKLSTDGLILAGAIGKPSIERTIYDAPETIQGRIGAAADIWALGATLVEILTQRPPAWYGASAGEPAVPEMIPEPLATIARECLRKDAARRCTLDQIRSRLDPGAVVQPAKKKAVLEFKARPERPAKGEGPSKVGGAAIGAKSKQRMAMAVGAGVVLLAVFAMVEVRSHHEDTALAGPEARSAAPAPLVPAAVPVPAQAHSAQRPAATAPKPKGPAAAASRPTGSSGPEDAIAQEVEPEVPASALRTISGTVKVAVRVSVDGAGGVTDAALESAGPSKYFAGKAMEAARRWAFKPAEAGGQSQWILEFEFRQSGVTASAKAAGP